ncbi:MAG TPA: hypothetical protein VK148_31305 [Xanthobacteraceae bacterium]|jgi:hypothetical protein|nr:hypothetical protein [Xanthobacteraceae bacterium]
MGLQLQNFPLVFTLAAMVLTPAFGQAVPPTVGAANGGSESAESIPDFSGPWVHPLPGFEPLPSGPTALVNRSRRPNGTGDILKLAGDHTNPILKPEAAEVVKGHGELGLNGIGDPNPRNQCWPAGVPFVFTNGPTQLLQQPDKVIILYGYDQQVRRVRLNQPHPAQVTPSWYGNSVGHYEGDTLVIDTVGIKVGRYSMVDWYGTPHTEALHVVERYRLIDPEAAKDGFARDAKQHNVAQGMRNPNKRGKYLQLQFTVEDKGVFTTPWTATMTYGNAGRNLLPDWAEQVCAENIQWYPGKDADVPRADKPDF